MMRVERISFEDVRPFIRLGLKEHVSFANPRGAQWYGIRMDDRLVSIFCLVLKNGNARFKSNYTLEEYRRRGCLQASIEFAVRLCRRRGVKAMTAFCTPMSVGSHRRMGAREEWRKGDVTFLKYRF